MTTLSPSAHSRVHHWPRQGQWTYAAYALLPQDVVRYEVIRGDLYMSPAPRPKHQLVLANLLTELMNFVKEKDLGLLFPAPIDVRLTEEDTVVQPDIVFIAKARLAMVQDAYIAGAPDLLVEILSPHNVQHDRRVKYRLYAETGVPEYWIVDPDQCTVSVHVLRGNAYVPLAELTADGVIVSEQLSDLQLPVAQICR